MTQSKRSEDTRNNIPAHMDDIDTLVQVLTIHNQVDAEICKLLQRFDLDVEGLTARIEELENKVK